MMLTFDLYSSERRYEKFTVTVNPTFVESETESEKRPADSGWQQVAIVTMSSGERHTVLDHNRSVARQIAEAQEVTK